jgi:nitrogen fixation/metabolism regulation signal transduction histidine kinase
MKKRIFLIMVILSMALLVIVSAISLGILITNIIK